MPPEPTHPEELRTRYATPCAFGRHRRIRLRALPARELPKLLRSAWLSVAPPKLLAQLDAPVRATAQPRKRTRTRSKLR